jgi:sialate O-acetylesterase
MAVTTDVGDKDNVHPADKQTVGSRLALAARGLVYGEPLAYQPPLFREATTETQANGTVAMRVWFDHAERLTAKTRSVAGFELAGDDHNFAPADARIDGVTVVVTATGVTHPVYVRYAWAGYSPEGLYNAAGLPAATFTSDSSPLR